MPQIVQVKWISRRNDNWTDSAGQIDCALECLAWIAQVKGSDPGMPCMDSAGRRDLEIESLEWIMQRKSKTQPWNASHG
jgi:hypothetical protein